MMARECIINPNNHRTNDVSLPMNQQGSEKVVPIVIEDDVWIDSCVIIFPGVHIKVGSVITAEAVATRDVPAFSVVGGVSAKVIRYKTKKLFR